MSPESLLELHSEEGSHDLPVFILKGNEVQINLVIRTGIDSKRWESDALKILNEKPDIFLCSRINGVEKPFLALEFCDAIKAGNQAWQRFTRAAELASNKIHYFYHTIPFKYEREKSDSSKKAIRHGSIQIPLAHLQLSIKHNIVSVEIYDKTSIQRLPEHGHIENEDDMKSLICDLLINDKVTETGKSNIKNILKGMSHYITDFVDDENLYKDLFYSKIIGDTEDYILECMLDPDCRVLYGKNDIVAHVKKQNSSFKKIVKKASTEEKSYKLFKNILPKAKWIKSIGHDPAISLIFDVNAFVKELSQSLKIKFDDSINSKLCEQDYLVFIPLYAHKPEGEDSRPDRGVLALLKTLSADLINKENTMIWIYSKGVPESWRMFTDNPSQNQLWSNILDTAGYIYIAKYGKLFFNL